MSLLLCWNREFKNKNKKTKNCYTWIFFSCIIRLLLQCLRFLMISGVEIMWLRVWRVVHFFTCICSYVFVCFVYIQCNVIVRCKCFCDSKKPWWETATYMVVCGSVFLFEMAANDMVLAAMVFILLMLNVYVHEHFPNNYFMYLVCTNCHFAGFYKDTALFNAVIVCS